nr:kinesin-like protein KIF1C [Cherax quadricarinatus]
MEDHCRRPTGLPTIPTHPLVQPTFNIITTLRYHVSYAGVTRHPVRDAGAAWSLLERGQTSRSVASTATHSRSSRSHALLTLDVTQPAAHTRSTLTLVDLAGSERASERIEKTRLTEGASINRSLVTLGNVISALGNQLITYDFFPKWALSCESMKSTLAVKTCWNSGSGVGFEIMPFFSTFMNACTAEQELALCFQPGLVLFLDRTYSLTSNCGHTYLCPTPSSTLQPTPSLYLRPPT